ncbi:DUF4148 domain-containing protein [Paraburkholderia sp. RL18-085-BIA-A]|uniref:DUF4148 domain-containing protein n=1 Tax=Paraburkholderia sp. RL18-085-BIA-A TaxID=3031633 RepID=UPI0038BA09A2
MKRAYYALLIASAFSLPSLSHADTAGASTIRAQVRAELVAAEQAGQYPQSVAHYPDAAPDAALTHVAHRAETQAAVDSAYGPEITGYSASGFRAIRVRAVANGQPPLGDVFRGRK